MSDMNNKDGNYLSQFLEFDNLDCHDEVPHTMSSNFSFFEEAE